MEKEDNQNLNQETSQEKENKTMSEKIKDSAKKVKEKVLKDEKIEISKKEYDELKTQLEEYKNDYLRSRADFENFRRRTQEELSQARDRAINSFVIEILPSIDNFEMSLKMTDNKEMFVKGVEMIHSNLKNTLKEHHFEEYEPQVGEEFDPGKHEPILIDAPEHEENKVIAVIQKGYNKKDSIIRPARVHIKKVNSEEKQN